MLCCSARILLGDFCLACHLVQVWRDVNDLQLSLSQLPPAGHWTTRLYLCSLLNNDNAESNASNSNNTSPTPCPRIVHIVSNPPTITRKCSSRIRRVNHNPSSYNRLLHRHLVRRTCPTTSLPVIIPQTIIHNSLRVYRLENPAQIWRRRVAFHCNHREVYHLASSVFPTLALPNNNTNCIIINNSNNAILECIDGDHTRKRCWSQLSRLSRARNNNNRNGD
jgi:hypothetical protein